MEGRCPLTQPRGRPPTNIRRRRRWRGSSLPRKGRRLREMECGGRAGLRKAQPGARGLGQFLKRGLATAWLEGSLITMTHSLLKLHAVGGRCVAAHRGRSIHMHANPPLDGGPTTSVAVSSAARPAPRLGSYAHALLAAFMSFCRASGGKRVFAAVTRRSLQSQRRSLWTRAGPQGRRVPLRPRSANAGDRDRRARAGEARLKSLGSRRNQESGAADGAVGPSRSGE